MAVDWCRGDPVCAAPQSHRHTGAGLSHRAPCATAGSCGGNIGCRAKEGIHGAAQGGGGGAY